MRNIFKGFTYLIIIALIVGGFYVYKTQQSVGSWINTQSLDLSKLESLVDHNKNLWKEYQDSADPGSVYVKYPFYLSEFTNVSADPWISDLVDKDVRIARYFRRSSDNGLIQGRSYWIILKNAQQDTKGLDVKAWIVRNKLNLPPNFEVLREDLRKEVPVKQVVLGGKDAYEVQFVGENTDIPSKDMIYFQTKNGIRAIGLESRTGEKSDYIVFREILSTFKFVN